MPLTLLDDTTNGFRQSGTVHFDPPADWKPSRVGTGDGLYYVRVRTLTNGTAPVATTILGRNYVNELPFNGGFLGTMPADHMDEVGQFFGTTGLAFDHRAFYLALAEFLTDPDAPPPL